MGRAKEREKESASLPNSPGTVLEFCTENRVMRAPPRRERMLPKAQKQTQSRTEQQPEKEQRRVGGDGEAGGCRGGEAGCHFQTAGPPDGKGLHRRRRLRTGRAAPSPLQDSAVPPGRRSSLTQGAGGRGINPPVREGAIMRP